MSSEVAMTTLLQNVSHAVPGGRGDVISHQDFDFIFFLDITQP